MTSTWCVRLTVSYPGSAQLPLQQLGQVAGWTHPSPLGSGMNRRFGPWFAYRCAILTDRRLPRLAAARGADRCAGCLERPCLQHCPPAALTVEFAPQLSACGQYRLRPDSLCSGRCLAREACPQGRAHRYDETAMAYHYGVSLAVLRYWQNRAGD